MLEKIPDNIVCKQPVKKNSLLTLLPEVFTREDVRKARILMGMSDTSRELKNLLGQWKCRQQVVFDEEKQLYRKTQKHSQHNTKLTPQLTLNANL